jgi:hypothetical protein
MKSRVTRMKKKTILTLTLPITFLSIAIGLLLKDEYNTYVYPKDGYSFQRQICDHETFNPTLSQAVSEVPQIQPSHYSFLNYPHSCIGHSRQTKEEKEKALKILQESNIKPFIKCQFLDFDSAFYFHSNAFLIGKSSDNKLYVCHKEKDLWMGDRLQGASLLSYYDWIPEDPIQRTPKAYPLTISNLIPTIQYEIEDFISRHRKGPNTED